MRRRLGKNPLSAVVSRRQRKKRVCVLSSSYANANSPTEKYDDCRCTPELWISPSAKVRYEFKDVLVEKADSYRALRASVQNDAYDVYVNLCDGAKDERRAGVDVISALEELNVAFTGADSRGFEPNKVEMKVLLAGANVLIPNFVVVRSTRMLAREVRHLKFPVIVKHVSGYASVGIHEKSKCMNIDELKTVVDAFIKEHNFALIEEFIRGREGTVLVCPDRKSPTGVRVFPPLMMNYLKGPDDFAHFSNKWDVDQATEAMEPSDPAYPRVVDLAINAHRYVLSGVGYGRCDFRIDEKNDVYFLEINANCGLYYNRKRLPEGDYSDRMITEDKQWSHDEFFAQSVMDAQEHRALREPWYMLSHDATGQFVSRAAKSVPKGTALFRSPSLPVPVIARAVFNVTQKEPTVRCVVCRGDMHPTYVSVRHSCEPNMQFVHGQTQTFESVRSISKGEELTVDYATIRDPKMPPFKCRCGTAACRSVIVPSLPRPRDNFQSLQKIRRLIMRKIKQKSSLSDITAEVTSQATQEKAPAIPPKDKPTTAVTPPKDKSLVATTPQKEKAPAVTNGTKDKAPAEPPKKMGP